MRSLKFRAWVNEHWVDWIPTCKTLGAYNASVIDTDGYTFEEDNPFIVEQYTGLEDKNGKEIYEGDILGNEWGNGYISWCDKCKQFQYYISGECMACSGDVQWYELVEDNGKLEIIGNVHEDPELIGGVE